MKRRFALIPVALTLGLASVACSQVQSGDASSAPAAGVASSQENLITATGNIMMWPAGPISWVDGVGTWPISVWSTAPIGALAFDVAGVTNLGCSVVGAPGLTAFPISTAYLNAFTATTTPWLGAGAPLLGTAGLLAPAYGYAGAYAPLALPAYGFAAYAPGTGLYGATFADNALYPWLSAWTTPMLTSSALMLNDLAVTSSMLPYTINLTFTAPAIAAQTAATTAATTAAINAASLSIFATPIASTALTAATVPFSSMVYPIMLPLGLPAVPAAAPLLGPAVVGTTIPGPL